jgi:acyl-CoA synthetase (AMP-forming)/AMP-acid ligase II
MVRLFPYSLKQASVVAVLGCLIAGGVAAMDSPRASNDQTALVSVNRTNKGDRLLSVAKPAAQLNGVSSATKLSTQPKGPPLGCDPLFSSIADPVKARLYYRRCAV